MILLIDNYDSFSYNLYQLIGTIRADIRVIRNDEMTVGQIEQLKPEIIVISPGPGRPEQAGICIEMIQKLYDKIPILGVCLGHQSICEALGGTVTYAKHLMHGKSSMITVDTGSEVFCGLESGIRVARYHSLAAEASSLPECLKVIATADDGEIMAVEHKEYPVVGLQFHPESILTEQGKQIIQNYIRIAEKKNNKQEGKKMIREAIIALSKKEDLSYETAQAVMDEIMSGEASQIQMSAYLTALAMKGETIDEITASAAGMRAHCIKLLHDEEVLEIVGTGGDQSNSFNISTTSSLVISAAGVPVAKHGNRAASSKCGAADVLEALGVNITVSPEKSTELLKKINLCFLFAQNYHIAMKYVAPVRKELGIRTVFNILGPLSNPAGANMQVMGVYEEALVEPLARVLTKLGVKSAMVVYGQDKLDEISMSAPTTVCEVRNGEYKSYTITPEDFGFTRCAKEELVGGTPEENAEITRGILNGKKGAKRDAVALNAGAGLYVAGKAATLEEGVRMAEQLIDSRAAMKRLEEFIQCSNE